MNDDHRTIAFYLFHIIECIFTKYLSLINRHNVIMYNVQGVFKYKCN
jgi:hypothetical protein